MIVAIDYDLTYTRDPAAWDAVINTLRTAGHKVIVVTSRSKEESVKQISSGKITGPNRLVYYTNGAPKHWHMQRHHNIHVDIWIDDDPRSIYEGR